MKPGIVAVLLMAAAAPLPAVADDAHHPDKARVAQASAQLAEGEVRRVDKETGKITLRHGPIPNLDMPAMSMVFQVKDPAILDKVRAGDKVRFSAEKSGGSYVVTHIEATK